MPRKNKKSLLVISVIACILLGTILSTKNTEAENPTPFFSISILAPNSSTLRNQWCTLMVEQLPKIGIEVDVFDHTGWAQIYPRTFAYPGPYPIPSYENGGFDILFIGWDTKFDFNPTYRFHTNSIIPNGDNYYQYSNPEMDYLIENYTSFYTYENLIYNAKKMQALLHDELPSIPIIYPGGIVTMNKDFNLTSWDSDLWFGEYQAMENWLIPGQTEFHYAAPADMVDFYIYTFDSKYDGQWLNQIYSGMIKRESETYRWIPNLATSFSTTDGLTWNFQLHPDASWADGTALTTQDVNYSYNLLLDPNLVSTKFEGVPYLQNSSINIVNDYEYEITFFEPYLFHDSNLAFKILPKHIWESIAPEDHTTQAASWALTDPNKLMGAGPYYLEEYDSTQEIIHLKTNPYYSNWSGITPNFDDIYFDFYSNKEGALLALQTGSCDMVDIQFYVQKEEVPTEAKYIIAKEFGIQEMGINCMHPIIGTGEFCPISSPESGIHIRKAMSHLIPRDIIVEEMRDGIAFPGITPWSPISQGFDESLEPYMYGIELARNEMRAAGYVYPEDTILNSSSLIIGLSFESIISTMIIALIIPVFIKTKRKNY